MVCSCGSAIVHRLHPLLLRLVPCCLGMGWDSVPTRAGLHGNGSKFSSYQVRSAQPLRRDRPLGYTLCSVAMLLPFAATAANALVSYKYTPYWICAASLRGASMPWYLVQVGYIVLPVRFASCFSQNDTANLPGYLPDCLQACTPPAPRLHIWPRCLARVFMIMHVLVLSVLLAACCAAWF